MDVNVLLLIKKVPVVRIRLKFHGTDTDPTRMRLSCNFVNVYTIAYRVQYTFTRVHMRIPNGQPREDPRAEIGEDVRVGVCPMEFKLKPAPCPDDRIRF